MKIDHDLCYSSPFAFFILMYTYTYSSASWLGFQSSRNRRFSFLLYWSRNSWWQTKKKHFFKRKEKNDFWKEISGYRGSKWNENNLYLKQLVLGFNFLKMIYQRHFPCIGLACMSHRYRIQETTLGCWHRRR